MTTDDTSDITGSAYRYLHLSPDELAHLSPAELLKHVWNPADCSRSS